MSTPTKRNRWNFRVSAGDDQAVRQAAEALDRSHSDFVRSAAVKEAEQVLADRTVFRLERGAWDRLIELLDAPPSVPDGLRDLFSRPSVFE